MAVRQVVRGGQRGGQTHLEVKKTIIDSMMENPKISRKEISKILNINISAVQKHLEKLKKEGIIRREGGDFGGSWQVIVGIC